MTDAEFEAQRARVERLIERWHTALGLGWWRITHTWRRDHLEDDDGDPDVDSVARAHVRWQYAHARISWNLPLVAEQSEDDLEFIVVHEYGHVLLNEMRELLHHAENWLQHEEHAATTLAKAFIWAREAGLADYDPLALNG